jgi:hypothetical protein
MVRAQALNFDVHGGSLGGSLDLDLYPGAYPFDLCIVLLGVTPGPTPIAMFDASDPRSVDVGTQILGASFFGTFGLDLHARFGPYGVPNAPGLVDHAFFFQGITLPGVTTLVDQISLPRVVRLAPAGAFHDRGLLNLDERAFATALLRADGRSMLVGGGQGALLAQVAHRTTDVYDPLTDTFSYGTSMNANRSLHTQTMLQDGRYLIAGGVDRFNNPQASCEVYDPVTDTFTLVASMVSPRMGHTATLLPDGRVFASGGLAAMTVTPSPAYAIFDTTNSTEIYDPVADTWTAGPNLRTPRAAHAAMLRPDGRVILCGGISWDNLIIVRLPAVRATTDVFDPVTNTIAAGPAMTTPRSLTDATAIGSDRWLLAGGISTLTLTNVGTPTAAAEIYDAVANTWTAAGSMATARGNHKVFGLGNNRWLHAGGANGDILNPVPLSTTEIFDAGSNAWSLGPNLLQARAGAVILPAPTGEMQLFGGGTTGGGITRLVEYYYH